MRPFRSIPRVVLVALVVTLSGCGPDPATPLRMHLARLERLVVDKGLAAALESCHQIYPDVPSLSVTTVEDGEAFWIERHVPPDAWEHAGVPGLYVSDPVLTSVGSPRDGSPAVRMLTAGVELEHLAPDSMRRVLRSKVATPGTFFYFRNKLYVAPVDLGPPPGVRHLVFLRPGRQVDGVSRIEQDRFAGNGLAVLPGMRVECPIEIDGERTLRFATTSQMAFLDLGDVLPTLQFRVALDDKLLLSHDQLSSPRGVAAWHAIDLPADARGVLSFEVIGPPSLSAILSPIIGPRAPVAEDSATGAAGAADHRIVPPAWRDSEHPDIVLFLADTFRADNLTAYGCTLDLTPNLDRFADESLRFLNSWSPATWTLPAHASMFSSFFPTQHAVTSRTFGLTDEVHTIAERLAAQGYRTGAVTDSMVVSHRAGLDQGFEWWDERTSGLNDTLERAEAFLAADDGRPTFLFMQSYAVHDPYRVSRPTRESHGQSLNLQGDAPELLRGFLAGTEQLEPGAPLDPQVVATLDNYNDLYRGGVVDLDRGFGEFVKRLEQRGHFGNGYVVFTSDHGEAFYEHGALGHGTGVWEEILRIPLLIRGPGLTPADERRAASLVDLPRTLASLAGIEADEDWMGSSLVSLDSDRPIFAHLATNSGGQPPTLAMIQSGRKLIAISSTGPQDVGELVAAYDLTSDPGEHDNLMPQHLRWVQELDAHLRPMMQALLQPLHAPGTRLLTDKQEEELRAMGYTDF